jgi:glutamyl-tRNA reductase
VHYLLIGTSHHVADVETRAEIARLIENARPLFPSMRIREHLLLSTCHRVELYMAADDQTHAEVALHEALGGHSLYVRSGLDVVRHLSRVACGLESLVVGEAEIAGQIRRAAASARHDGTLGRMLDTVVAAALRASGRARAETRIGTGVLSAASAAVALVDRTLGGLAYRRVLVIGAGQAGRQVLARLEKLGSGPRFVTSRSGHHAAQAAEKHGASAVHLDQLAATAAGVEAVIAAAQAPSLLLTADAYASAAANRTAPVFMVDLSAPRVLDPALANVRGVTLRTVDDLGDIVRQSTFRRLGEVPHVDKIIGEEVSRLSAKRSGRRLQIR